MQVCFFRRLAAATVLFGLIFLAACGHRDYPRGQFQGYVLGKTQTEIVEQVGPPTSVDSAGPEKPVLVYEKKTFDVDNYNKPDPRTRIFLEMKDGKIVASDVVFG